jgi:Uncharacterised nucleotidyltransferase
MSAATAAIKPRPAAKGRFRAELELLLAATAPPAGSARSLHLENCIDQPLDWEFVVRLADAHGLAPLLFWSTQKFQHAVPGPHFAALRSQYESNARKNLLLSHMLLEVQELLQRAGVPSLAWKGPTLAACAYRDIALREFSDLDLFVPRKHIQRAKEILISSGFRAALQLTPAQERLYLKLDNEFPFHRGPHENVLELQWRVAPHFYAVDFDLGRLFERAILTRIGSLECRTLCPEDLLLTLCVHAAKHGWARLSWITDVAWLLGTQNLDWLHVQHEAEAVGIERILLVTLALARHFYAIRLPRIAQMEIADCLEVQRLTLQMADRIIHQRALDISSPEYFLLMCHVRERWRDRVRLLRRLAFMPGPGEWTKISLPRALAPFYLVIRAFRLSGKMASLFSR